jgi:hypothetical protein
MALRVKCEGLPGASVSSLLAGASGNSLLAGASGLLVEELLTMALVLLAGTSAGASVVLGEELLEVSGLLAGMSGLLGEELLEAGSFECSLTQLLPGGLEGESGVEAAVAKP